METVTVFNFSPGRMVRREGREYLSCPMTLLRPQVLNGSQGPLYYPSAEIEASTPAWNGVPITLGHPEVNGVYISAASPWVPKMGSVENAQTSNGVLRADGLFDLGKLSSAAPLLLSDLQSGRKVELSTGLGLDTFTPPGFSYRIARNFLPDHVAILTDKAGACSLNDGCGVFNVSNSLTCQCAFCRRTAVNSSYDDVLPSLSFAEIVRQQYEEEQARKRGGQTVQRVQPAVHNALSDTDNILDIPQIPWDEWARAR